MNRLLWLALCVLCVQALNSTEQATTVEDDVETSTHYAVQTIYPEGVPQPPGVGEITDPESLKHLREDYRHAIEKYYNDVYNREDANYSILAKIRLAGTIVIAVPNYFFYLTMVRTDCPKSNPKCNGRKLAAYDCKVKVVGRYKLAKVEMMECLK